MTEDSREESDQNDSGSVEKISLIRKRIGAHMVASKATSPHVLTTVEVDYEGVDAARAMHGSLWKESEGTSLTYLPFLVRALVAAIAEYPKINASVGDGELLIHRDVNLAVAVDLDYEGLVAPVIHNVPHLTLAETARELAGIARRARARELTPNDMAGGTFTVTNAGSYGTFLTFPVINQPQVAILSTDGVRRKPAVVTDDEGEEVVAVRSIGVLSLAWDHRCFDGAYASAFLDRLRNLVERTEWTAEL